MSLSRRRFLLGLSALLAACGGGGGDPAAAIAAALRRAGNPLATPDQVALDIRAIRLFAASDFEPLRTEARLSYITARQQLPSAEALSRLDLAIDELVFSAIQKVVNGDAYRPVIYWVNAQPRRWFELDVPGSRYSYDNPDNIYRIVPIDGALRYELRGQRFQPGPADVTFSLISNPTSQNTVAFLDGRDLVLNPDGSYVITIDADPANGRANHLQSTSQVVQLFIRNNLGDWETETPDDLTIVRTDTATAPAAPSDQQILLNAYGALQQAVLFYGVGALAVKTHSNPVNTLPSPQQSATLGTLVSQASSFGHFRLGEGEGLLIRLTRGGAGYFVVPVTDPWMITVDPARHQSSLNQAQAVPDADGHYTFVVSPQDPGLANWLDSAGLREGTLMVRWQGLPESAPEAPAVSAEVVALADLRTSLGDTVAWVDATTRAERLARRQAGYVRRIAVN